MRRDSGGLYVGLQYCHYVEMLLRSGHQSAVRVNGAWWFVRWLLWLCGGL